MWACCIDLHCERQLVVQISKSVICEAGHLPAFRRDRALVLRTGACRGSLPPFGRLSLARRGRGVPGRVRSGG